ncbi:conserved Plasmodium protein, unknown function [Plasmodium knowlesi strain H]|uniref:Uncharacterized protein n=3 Tax=Plasmodium knowlesi TaxID=5850 RepID=A0A5K1UTA0_PLAKH|nr:conserved Plasmodium protein, unknown function [Plasmodium knowlesi strain H]OTN64622.1 Uncharacterized protein PKNOH_S130203500 [Plasmodium knowlesi]CAA9989195.1 conserved Plasmodium protein, unknown function [Plasmodium knowlesi strain H]SBO27372.1 conserved Plasmodium protein, unknown function [Plasmodium knowlesi strain H]SBO27417.1 conserved Plasmodium protein, unknown function [Plasmodium knowlesi strain H]VVS78669.1 conserved Plasmodium protein, unknown function [Plasmodium knowlesi |eukprot:XP_002261541.1 hypothetical protein, conserved in Plasmodium species [Plasmodium knowlesi strain H]
MKYAAFRSSMRFAAKFCGNNNYKLYMNSVPQFSSFAYGKHLKTNPLTNRLDDLLKRNSTLISTISINGLDDLITQSSKIESISMADWLLNLVEEYQLILSRVNMTTISSWFSIRSINELPL